MKDIKYTKDGKKVVIVGKLNAEETIVQEVFVSEGGAEIPSGENFVVRSLHEQPMESLREKKLRETEERFKRDIKKLEEQTKRETRDLLRARERAKAKVRSFEFIAKNSEESQLETLLKFLGGEITHLFSPTARGPKIISFNDSEAFDESSWGRVMVEGIKLISLHGRFDGNLEYRLQQYWDSSGNNKIVIPCSSYEEALKLAQEKFNQVAAKKMEENKDVSFKYWEDIEGLIVSLEISEYQKKRDLLKKEDDIQKLKDSLKKKKAERESLLSSKNK